MTDVWAEANALADRTRAAIRAAADGDLAGHEIDLARLDSDLASLRDALDGLALHRRYDFDGTCDDCGTPYPCQDAARFARQRDRALTELDRTASAYGVGT